ncbi:hypothetical protein V5O48_017240, partial [Marasmius crinis-equi]
MPERVFDPDNDIWDFELKKEDWGMLYKFTEALLILKDAMLWFSSAEATVADVIPAMDKIDEFLTTAIFNIPEDPDNPATTMNLSYYLKVSLACAKKMLNKYYALTDASKVYRIAMVLHPQHKLAYFHDQNWEEPWIKRAHDLVKAVYQERYHDRLELIDKYGKKEMESGNGGQSKMVRATTSDIMTKNLIDLPTLATTVDVEWTFSQARHVVTWERNRLSASRPYCNIAIIPGHHRFDPNASAAQGYALPDPAFIAVSANEKTVAGFLTTWLQLRQVLMYRLMSPTFQPLPTGDWRSILGIEMHGLKADTRAATKHREQEQMLQKCLISGKMQGAIDLSNLGSAPVEWHIQTLQPFMMPPIPITKEVLWELHEINFRYELIAVDRACYRGLSSAAECQQEVLATIHHFNTQIVPDTLDAGKEGFASTDSDTRRRALHDLYVVMEGWVGSLGKLPRCLSDSAIKARLDIAETSTISTQEFNDLEYALIFHYVSVCRK